MWYPASSRESSHALEQAIYPGTRRTSPINAAVAGQTIACERLALPATGIAAMAAHWEAEGITAQIAAIPNGAPSGAAVLSVPPSILTQEPSELVLIEKEWSGSPVRVMASYLPAINNRHD